MSVFEIMFSPTGGTKKVSNMFTKAFAPESTVIDLLKKIRIFLPVLLKKRMSASFPFLLMAEGFLHLL